MENSELLRKIKRIHEAILWLFFLGNLAAIYFWKITEFKTYIITTSIWLLAHPLLYLFFDMFKLIKDKYYEPARFGMVCMVFNMILGVLICTVIFKIEREYYTDYWYLWYIGSALSLIVPSVICLILTLKHRNDKPSGAKIVRNR